MSELASEPMNPAMRTGWRALPVILTPVFMINLDSFIVNVAMASIQRDLHASATALEFIGSGFSLAFGAGLITSGRLGDLYGRRRLFVIGLLVFTMASAVGGFAPTAAILVLARVAQGVGATLMSPQALALLGLVYSGDRKATALRAYVLTIGLSAVLGQLLGGLLIGADVAHLGWRAILLVNVPVGLVAIALTPVLVPNPVLRRTERLDLPGALLVTAAAIGLVLPLIVGGDQHWPLWTKLVPVATAVPLALFVRHIRRVGAPLISPGLFTRRAFSVGLAIVLVFHLAVAEFFLIYPYWLQRGRGLSSLVTGLWFLPLSAGFFVATMVVRRLVTRWRHQTLAIGALLLAAGYLGIALAVDLIGTTGGVAWLVPGLLVAGFGMGTVMTPLISLVVAHISERDAAAASGALASAIQLGNALGVAVVCAAAYGSLRTGAAAPWYTAALVKSALILAAVAAGVAVLVQFLTPIRRLAISVPERRAAR